MFYKVFIDNLNLETSREFIFLTARRSTNYFPQIHLKSLNIKSPLKACQRSLLKAWALISKLHLAECPYLTDSVQLFVFLSAHFLTFICFLSVTSFFDFVTVCKHFVVISTRLLIVSASFYLFISRFYYPAGTATL